MLDANFYSSLSNRYEDAFGHDEGLLVFLKLLLTHLPPESKVLDFGCGTGRPVASTIQGDGHHVTGVDISDEMIKLSRQAVPNGTFEVADMQSFSTELREHFDAVLNILSLFTQSREGIEGLAKKWQSWVKLGSLLAICMIAAEDLIPDLSQGYYDLDGLCARNIAIRFMKTEVKISLLTRAGWKKLLEDHGFDIIETQNDWHRPPKDADSDNEPHYFIIARRLH